MKRMLTLACVALLATSASAVTWNSLTTNATTPGRGSVDVMMNVGESQVVAVAVTYNTASVTDGIILGLCAADGDWLNVSIENGVYTLVTRWTPETIATSVAASGNGTDVLSFVLTRNSNYSVNVAFSINGTVQGSVTLDVDTLTDGTATGYAMDRLYWDRNIDFTEIEYTGDTTYTAAYAVTTGKTVTTAEIYAAVGVTLVPEPTCLALLALGVAGLALRRKAA